MIIFMIMMVIMIASIYQVTLHGGLKDYVILWVEDLHTKSTLTCLVVTSPVQMKI